MVVLQSLSPDTLAYASMFPPLNVSIYYISHWTWESSNNQESKIYQPRLQTTACDFIQKAADSVL